MQESDINCKTLENITLDEAAITAKEYNDILNIQSEILSMLGSSLTDILARLCTFTENLVPNSAASIRLINKDTGLTSALSAPSMPHVGCKVCACWSMPVRDENKEAIGTVALYSYEHRSPAPFHKKLLQTAAFIVNIVLKNSYYEKKLKLFSAAMQNAAEGVLITDENNRIIEVNQAFETSYGLKEKDIVGKNPKIIASGEHNNIFYQKMWKSLNTKQTWSGEILNKRFDGSLLTQWLSISTLHDEDNKNTHNYLAIFTDLTKLKETQNKLEEMAYKDELTGLCNKTHLEKLISINKEQTLILLNINNFSYINTAYGYEIGDKLLIKIANALRENFKVSHICRINSDEFALLFNKGINIQEKISHLQNFFLQ